jgi:phospholipid transport system substrate-binding protein
MDTTKNPDHRSAKSLTRLGGAIVITMLIIGLIAQAAIAASPKEEVQAAIEKVTAILKDPNLKSEAKKAERLQQLRQVIFPKFDFAEMAKRSLGPNWQKRSPAEQQEFVKLFTAMIESSYVDSLESYNGEKVSVTGEKVDQGYAQVNSRIAGNNGEEFSVDYKLYQADNGWKIYDVVIENISIVNNYRSQFNRVIGRSSFDELLRRMKEKQFDAAGKKQKT